MAVNCNGKEDMRMKKKSCGGETRHKSDDGEKRPGLDLLLQSIATYNWVGEEEKSSLLRFRVGLKLLLKKHFSAFGFKKALIFSNTTTFIFLGFRVKSAFIFSITQKALILPNTIHFYFSKSLFSQTPSTFI
ncbi:unnamed protein product [Cuscuta epithymum]|uniref:Uncharacterized protein n=1 Tax=Cuscuta epithymum TaxID=186058 RepID=A0AAV0F9Y8_9ASTE|nr:unnamed protein product [Cuscuta epithymum]